MRVGAGEDLAGSAVRLNIGSGAQRAEGWATLDRAGDVDVVHDLTGLPLPLETDSCEGIVAHHVLDLLELDTVVPLLRDLRRILVPGGWLRISCADLRLGVDASLRNDHAWFPEARGTIEESFDWFIRQGGARRWWATPTALHPLLRQAGFGWVLPARAGLTNGPAWLCEFDSRPAESFFVETS